MSRPADVHAPQVEGFYSGLARDAWVDWADMLSMAAIGLLLLGIMTRPAAIAWIVWMGAGRWLGLGAWWERRPLPHRFPILR